MMTNLKGTVTVIPVIQGVLVTVVFVTDSRLGEGEPGRTDDAVVSVFCGLTTSSVACLSAVLCCNSDVVVGGRVVSGDITAEM